MLKIMLFLWEILQHKKPDDWVIATNKENTVKKFIEIAAKNFFKN